MSGAHVAAAILYFCWLSWIAYWKFSAHKQKPAIERQSVMQRLSYSVLFIPSLVLLLADTRHTPVLKTLLISHSVISASIGTFICVVGFVFTIWSRRVLADNWSADVTFKEDHVLVTNGPYAITRHPIYTWLMVMIIGTAVVKGNVAGFIAIPLAFLSFLIKLHQEEKLMQAHFGDSYSAYKSRTKQIIPFLF